MFPGLLSIPFPQNDVHTEGFIPGQVYPAAGPVVHPMLQPIPSLLKSSQFSLDDTFPSEQVKEQKEGVPAQSNPNSTVEQSELHPSSGLTF